MNKYINTNFEISLVSMIKYVLKRWLGILIAGLICCAICVGIKYFTFVPETVEPVQEGALPYDQLYDSYSEGQINLNNEMYQLYQKADEADEYTQNSIYYNLNPYSVSCSSASFGIYGISTDSYDAQAVTNAYIYAITNGEYLSELSDSMSIPEEYLRELISVNPDNTGTYWTMTVDHDLGGYIQILVYGENEEQTECILDAVIDAMPDITAHISGTIGHECEMISRQYSQSSEMSIMNDHYYTDLYITDLYAKLNNLTNNQKNIAEPVNLNRAPVTSISKATLVKYGAAGLIIGMVMYAGVLVLFYILSNKVTDDIRFRNRYNVKDLGQSDAMIIANIMNYRCSDGKLLLTGTASEQKAQDKIKSISKELKNIQTVEAMDILNNADSRMKLADCNDVVLIEERSKSKYYDIDEELNVLSSMDKNVVGVILL